MVPNDQIDSFKCHIRIIRLKLTLYAKFHLILTLLKHLTDMLEMAKFEFLKNSGYFGDGLRFSDKRGHR